MKRISDLHDLVAERQRLQQRLELLKRDINSEVIEIKEKFKPLIRIISFITGSSNNGNSESNGKSTTSLLKMGANLGVDLFVGSKLKKAGWFVRWVLPPLLRKISSTVINKVRKTS